MDGLGFTLSKAVRFTIGYEWISARESFWMSFLERRGKSNHHIITYGWRWQHPIWMSGLFHTIWLERLFGYWSRAGEILIWVQIETIWISFLKKILAINPEIKLMASPCSTKWDWRIIGITRGGSLLEEYESVYANYLVKYIKQWTLKG